MRMANGPGQGNSPLARGHLQLAKEGDAKRGQRARCGVEREGGPERGGDWLGCGSVRMWGDWGKCGRAAARTRQCSLGSKTSCRYSHQQLVGHWVDNTAHDRLQLPPPGNPPIDEVRDAGVCEETQSPRMLVMKNQVPDSRRRDKP